MKKWLALGVVVVAFAAILSTTVHSSKVAETVPPTLNGIWYIGK